MARKYGKKNEMQASIKNGIHIILGGAKVGKTTLTVELAEKIYGDKEKVLIVSTGSERAFEGINGAIYEEVKTWKELMDLTTDLSKDNGGFDIISFDTIDQIIPMAESEVMRLHAIQYKEQAKSFNSAFGGFGEPRKKMSMLIDQFIMTLMQIDAAKFLISHNKVREIKSKIGDEAYSVLSTNLSFDNFHAFSYKAITISQIVVDNKVEGGVVQGTERRIHFRGDGFIEAGGRLKYIVDSVPYDAKAYHDAIVDAITKDGGSIGDTPQIAPTIQAPQLEEVDNFLDSLGDSSQEDVAPLIEKIMSLSKQCANGGVSNKTILGILATYKVKNPNSIDDADVAKSIIKDLEDLLV